MSCGCHNNCLPATVTVDCEGLCKDGKSAYELWAENQPPDADTSLQAYWNSMRANNVESITVETEYV